MQSNLKNVLRLCKYFAVLTYSTFYCQNIQVSFNDSKLEIAQNKNIIYTESNLPLVGICQDVEIIQSQFSNQFYMYIENTCTSRKSKRLLKIYWAKNYFVLLQEDRIVLQRNAIEGTSMIYKDLIKNSLLTIFEDDSLSNELKKIKNNTIEIWYKQKLIGFKKHNTNDLQFGNLTTDENEAITFSNVNLKNNIAFALYQNDILDEALYILNKINKIIPERVVAWLNIADVNWKLQKYEEAKKQYIQYLTLMKSEKKDLKKIPKYVFNRIK